MARILLLDDNDTAGRAMQAILASRDHTCVVATTAAEAWRTLRESVGFDLVFVELKLCESAAILFVERLRRDWFWKILPTVVYTYERDTKLVRRALGLRVQNYLIKPYNDALICREIAKALAHPWRDRHFEESRSFCALTGLPQETLIAMRREVMRRYAQAAQVFPAWAERRKKEDVATEIASLVSSAEAAGIWAAVDYLRLLRDEAEVGNWSAFAQSSEPLDFASRLIAHLIDPPRAPAVARGKENDVESAMPPTQADALAAERGE